MLVEEQLDLLLATESVSGGDFLLDPPLHTSAGFLQLFFFPLQLLQLLAAALHIRFDFINTLDQLGDVFLIGLQVFQQLVALSFDLVQLLLQGFDTLFDFRQSRRCSSSAACAKQAGINSSALKNSATNFMG